MRRGFVPFAAVLLFLCENGLAVNGLNHFNLSPLQQESKRSPHIAGGEEVEPFSYLYQVGLDIRRDNVYKHFCGGALIKNDWILTAAQCVDFKSIEVTAILGAHNLTEQNYGRRNIQAEKIVVHPQFDSSSLKNDLALLQVKRVRDADEGEDIVRPIRLPSLSQKNWWFWNWPEATITGWGYPNDNNLGISTVLRSVSTRVVPTVLCQLLHLSINIGDDHLCVSGWYNKGICAGDSGNPLVVDDTDGQKTLIGIASFSSSFGCDKSLPMGFTRLTSYLDWIQNVTGLHVRS